MRESNSHQRFWRPLSYHLTNPLHYRIFKTTYMLTKQSIILTMLLLSPSLVTSQLRCSVPFASQMSVSSRFRSEMQAFLTPRAATAARLSFLVKPSPY